MTKIFIIGFNKTATRAFHNLFKASNIKSVHWDNGDLAKKIVDNHKSDKPLLNGYEEYQAFSDMEFVSKTLTLYPHRTLFKKLHHCYPGSYFILNTRNVYDWIESRKAHADGLYLSLCMKANDLTEEELTALWLEEYYFHCNEAIQFFKGYRKFISLDIERFEPEVLKSFLCEDFDINIDGWGHLKNHKARK